MQETRVWSLGWEDPLEKETATRFSTLTWKTPWTEEPSRLQSVGSQRVRHDWATSLSFFLSFLYRYISEFFLPCTVLSSNFSRPHKVILVCQDSFTTKKARGDTVCTLYASILPCWVKTKFGFVFICNLCYSNLVISNFVLICFIKNEKKIFENNRNTKVLPGLLCLFTSWW